MHHQIVSIRNRRNRTISIRPQKSHASLRVSLHHAIHRMSELIFLS
jgi:hypothetical protein